MSDNIKGLVVVFKNPIPSEVAEYYQQALLLMRDVAEVIPSVDNFNDQMNREMVRQELRQKLRSVV